MVIGRLRRPEPATLVWLGLTAILLLLVAFPLVKLLLVSLWPGALRGIAVELAGAGIGNRGDLGRVRGADGLGDVAHQHASEDAGLGAGAGQLYPAPLSGCHRLDPARWPQRRVYQPGLALAHRCFRPADQCLYLQRPGLRHGLPVVSADLYLRQIRARSGLVGDGGRGEYPGCGHLDSDAQGNAAAGLAIHPGRRDHRFSGGRRPVRHPGHYRHPRAHQHRDHPVVAVLRVSGAGRSRGR